MVKKKKLSKATSAIPKIHKRKSNFDFKAILSSFRDTCGQHLYDPTLILDIRNLSKAFSLRPGPKIHKRNAKFNFKAFFSSFRDTHGQHPNDHTLILHIRNLSKAFDLRPGVKIPNRNE